ncbi:MAG TPA: zinc finger domain-containing protein, partial [Thermosynechococcaceae cyanobacterium]
KSIAPVLCHLAEDIWQSLPYPASHKSVFQSGWVTLETRWQAPELAQKWQSLREIREAVNQVLELARKDKAIGSSLEAKILLFVSDSNLRQTLQSINPDSLRGNHTDELRYLFLASQVKVLDSTEPLKDLKYTQQSETIGVGVVDADGQKCDRCWNYSTHVGEFANHPLLCERCEGAISDRF